MLEKKLDIRLRTGEIMRKRSSQTCGANERGKLVEYAAVKNQTRRKLRKLWIDNIQEHWAITLGYL